MEAKRPTPFILSFDGSVFVLLSNDTHRLSIFYSYVFSLTLFWIGVTCNTFFRFLSAKSHLIQVLGGINLCMWQDYIAQVYDWSSW